MNRATRVVVSVFGVLAGLVGIEHAIGALLQGSVTPDGVTFLSWPDSPFFRVHAGEPAMTLIPNLFITGIAALIVCLSFLVWVVRFVDRKHGGLVLILLSILMLLVGGGFGPPLLGIIVGLAATRINTPLAWWRAHVSARGRRILGKLWAWVFIASLIAWLSLFPGANILTYFFHLDSTNLVEVLFPLALGSLLLAIILGFARDSDRQATAHRKLVTADLKRSPVRS